MLFILLMAILIRDRGKYLIVVCSAMFAVYGLHKATAIGIDSASSYIHIFNASGSINYGDISLRNIGFEYFTKFFHHLSRGNYQLYITTIAAFVSYSFYRFIKKYSVNPLLSIMWYFGMLYYIFMFSAVKQSIAMSILLYAFDALMDRKMIRYVIIVLVATLFHGPALVLLPAYWLSEVRIGKDYLLLIVIVLSITYIFRSKILQFMFLFYESGETLAFEPKFIGGKVIYMLIVIAIAIALRTPKQENRLYSTMLIFAGIAVVLQTFCYYNNIFERLADYYYQFSVLLIPLIFEKVGETNGLVKFDPRSAKIVRIFGSLLIMSFAIWRFYEYINVTASLYFLPFKFFWQ